MHHRIFLALSAFLLLSSCTKLSDLQNAYLEYEQCTALQPRFQSLDYIEPNLRVEVVTPLEVAPIGDYFLAGEVHYYDQYDQLLAIVVYGLGPEERWATKEIFAVANTGLSDASSEETQELVEGSTICRFDQTSLLPSL